MGHLGDLINKLADAIDANCRERNQLTRVSGLTLHKSVAPSPKVQTIYRPSICIVARGSKEVLFEKKLLKYNPSQFLVVSLNLPVTGCIVKASPKDPYLGLTLALKPKLITELSRSLPLKIGKLSSPGITVQNLDNTVAGPLLRMVEIASYESEPAFLADLAEKEIYYRLLQGPYADQLLNLADTTSKLYQLSHATDWIRENFTTPIDIRKLAKSAGMSTTSFYRYFKSMTKLSPVQYRTRVRLQEARRLIGTSEKSITEIAFSVGYESPSQFSREYRRLFGSSPVADVRAKRKAI